MARLRREQPGPGLDLRPHHRPGRRGGDAVIGNLPTADALDTTGLDVDDAAMAELLRVDVDEWRAEIPSIEEHYAKLGERLPVVLKDELQALEKRLSA